MKSKLIKGKIYQVRYEGLYGYDKFNGPAKFTGNKIPNDWFGPRHYEFEIMVKKMFSNEKEKIITCFPKDSVFPNILK